jgi:lipoprotein-anchoring transpeptidase ErfK/SrfK
MTNQHPSIDKIINQARKAIEADRPAEAIPLLREAARRAPQDPRPWLLLAGVAETQRERRVYLAQARRLDAAANVRSAPATAPTAAPRVRSQRSRWSLAALALLLLVLAGAALAFHPAGRALWGQMADGVVALAEGSTVASMPTAPPAVTNAPPIPSPTLAAATAEPTLTPTEPPAFPTKGAVAGGAPLPTWTPTGLPTPTLAPTMTPSPTPMPSPTPTAIPLVLGAPAPRPPGVTEGERWINVNLSTQTLVAYEGDVPVFETLVSSGLPQWPTVTGQYRTYAKYESQTMNGYLLGYDYYLPDVPYVMYFYNDYAIHGTYWHNNFGTPMSHGCVNVSTPDAGWLFAWAPVGTVVNVTY